MFCHVPREVYDLTLTSRMASSDALSDRERYERARGPNARGRDKK